MKRFFRHTVNVCAPFFALCVWAVSCADLSHVPAGGPKDVAPPVLAKARPEQGATGVSTVVEPIRLFFDEYVVLQNTEKIVTSPPLKKVSYTQNLKEVQVIIEDTLEADRTYTVNFKDAIGDLHESTPLRDFTYVFSTGSRIDSARFSGIVYDAVNLEPVKEASVMLYAQKPAVYPPEQTPDYVAVTDTGGFFEISYLKQGCYYVLAAAEDYRNYTIDPTEEKTAFSSSCWPTLPFVAQVAFEKAPKVKESDKQNRKTYDRARKEIRSEAYAEVLREDRVLYLYQDWEENKFLKESKFNAPGEILLTWYYMPQEDSLQYVFAPSYADVQTAERLMHIGDTTGDAGESTSKADRKRKRQRAREEEETEIPSLTWPDSLRYWVVVQDEPLQSKLYFDNLKVSDLRLTVNNGRFSDTLELMLPTQAAKRKDTAKFNVFLRKNSLFVFDSLVLDFSLPLESYRTDGAFLYEITRDIEGSVDTVITDVSDYGFGKIHAQRLSFSYSWKAGADYLLMLPSACFTDYLGRHIDTVRLRFSVPDLDAYGAVSITIEGLDSLSSEAYILQLVEASSLKPILEREVRNNGTYEFLSVPPGNVTFVLFNDADGNRRWDRGHYLHNLQPERRYIYPKKINAEADWRIEETWHIGR